LATGQLICFLFGIDLASAEIYRAGVYHNQKLQPPAQRADERQRAAHEQSREMREYCICTSGTSEELALMHAQLL
jgi:hypothetical protein